MATRDATKPNVRFPHSPPRSWCARHILVRAAEPSPRRHRDGKLGDPPISPLRSKIVGPPDSRFRRLVVTHRNGSSLEGPSTIAVRSEWQPPQHAVFGSLALIAVVIGAGAAAFAYTAGWFSPQRLTPDKLVAAFAPPGGPALGHRRNHAKGICFTGVFEANGAGSELSQARFSPAGSIPVLGRFNLGTADPNAPDATVRVRGMGLRISTPDGQEWRSAMIDPPFFPVSTPQAFYELLLASGSKDPNAMKTFASGASGVRGVRRLGEERALDRQLRGRAVQQPQQLRLHRRFRRRARGALVAAASGATGRGLARRTCETRPRFPRTGDRSSASPARRNGGPWW